MKRYDLYSKHDPTKNFSPLPNEVFYLGLSYGAIAVYGYLMHIEDRKTFQSYAGYNTIGRAVKMSANTVRKYVLELEDKHLIRTEPTTVVTRDGRKRNGTLRYHIRPIQEAVDYYYKQQLCRLEVDTERQKAQARLSRLCAAQESLPTAGQPMTPPTVERGVSGLCGPVCKVENGITFPSMVPDLALDTGKGLGPQGKSKHYRWQMPRKIRFWRITSWQKKK